MDRRIIWDEAKRLANLADRQLDFADAYGFDWDGALYRPGHSGRTIAIGRLDGRILAIVFVLYGREALSVVSMRIASRKERRLFNEFEAKA